MGRGRVTLAPCCATKTNDRLIAAVAPVNIRGHNVPWRGEPRDKLVSRPVVQRRAAILLGSLQRHDDESACLTK